MDLQSALWIVRSVRDRHRTSTFSGACRNSQVQLGPSFSDREIADAIDIVLAELDHREQCYVNTIRSLANPPSIGIDLLPSG